PPPTPSTPYEVAQPSRTQANAATNSFTPGAYRLLLGRKWALARRLPQPTPPRSSARMHHHARDAVDAEPGVPEAGVGCRSESSWPLRLRELLPHAVLQLALPIRTLARPPVVEAVGLNAVNRDVRRDPPLAGVVGCPRPVLLWSIRGCAGGERAEREKQ